MEISPITPHTPPLDMAAKSQAQTSEKVCETTPSKVSKTDGENYYTSTAPKRFDTFEKSEENASDTAGIYRMGEDENGNPKILFDKPEQAEEKADEPSKPEDAPKSERDKETEDTKCTVNTDKVDAEIKSLKQEKQELQRVLQSEKDMDKRAELEQRLQNLESELQIKDNDAYRKQSAAYTFD